MFTKTIKVRLDEELLDHVKKESEKSGTNVSTYVRWCIYTGQYLEDLNSYVRLRNQEND
jgi:predicted DNA binding CopG/RHH family protein